KFIEVVWYLKGQIKSTCFYLEGKRHGEMDIWHKDGTLFGERYYIHGELQESKLWINVETFIKVRQTYTGERKDRHATRERLDDLSGNWIKILEYKTIDERKNGKEYYYNNNHIVGIHNFKDGRRDGISQVLGL